MKQKKLCSRRRGALRNFMRAAAALLLVNHFFLIGLFLPVQALRRTEERLGTGRTAVVLRDWAPEVHKTHLTYLTESENVTMLSGAYLSLLGWTDGFGVPIDCSEDAALHGGFWSMSQGGKPILFYVFGRVDDPEIARVEVQTQYEDWESGEPVRGVAFSWSSGREDWAEKDGKRYFLFRKYPMDWSDFRSPRYVVAIGYNAEGNEIARRELEQGSSTHYG